MRLIERGNQCNPFDMPINYLQQLLMALGQIFSFYPYSGHMTSSEHSGDVIFYPKMKKTQKLRILEIMFRSIGSHQNHKNPSMKNENLGGGRTYTLAR